MSLAAIVLTYNEELHIQRCIESLRSVASYVYVIDCYSTDKTVEIATQNGALVIQKEWPGNQAAQVNWALANCDIDADWVMRLDADEYLLPELAAEINNQLYLLDKDISGVYLRRRVYFLNKWIRFGGCYPVRLLRIWRRNQAVCDDRLMDEHMRVTTGVTTEFKFDFVDHNLKSLTNWTQKHNAYASREAAELLITTFNAKGSELSKHLFGASGKPLKEILKVAYSRLPLFFRPFFYFIYRYFLRLGFLDGKAGFVWCLLQGFWYRFLVDAKIFEAYVEAGRDRGRLKEFFRRQYDIEI